MLESGLVEISQMQSSISFPKFDFKTPSLNVNVFTSTHLIRLVLSNIVKVNYVQGKIIFVSFSVHT